MSTESELIMSKEEQLKKWIEGESIHNGATPEKGECCPDFSCCRPALKTEPREAREEYARQLQERILLERDRLSTLFAMQYELNKVIGVDTATMTDEDRIKWVLNYSRAMQQELAELVDSVPWKWWAKYQKFDAQNAAVEVMDLLHFVISLAQVLGMDSDTVFVRYKTKHGINMERQASGYVKKDENDCKGV